MNYKNEPQRYLSQYSLTIKKILDELGYEPIDILDNIKTGKKCFVYIRNDELNFLLCTLKVNKDLQIFVNNEDVIEYFKKKKMLPNTSIEDYMSRLKKEYLNPEFNISNHLNVEEEL